MVTSSNILYSVSAVKRLLGLGDRTLVKIQEFAKVVWVWVKGKRPTFISKKAFKQHFVDRRKAQAKVLVVTKVGFSSNYAHGFNTPYSNGFSQHYTVSNQLKDTSYKVVAGMGAIACECEDYRNQTEFFGQGVCKHGYAVLAQLGYSSLKDFIASDCK